MRAPLLHYEIFIIIVYTAAPTGPPENLRTSSGAGSLGYTIECSGQAAIVTELTEFTITGLTPFTEYTCSVFASNSAGDGPSAVVVATTQTGSM